MKIKSAHLKTAFIIAAIAVTLIAMCIFTSAATTSNADLNVSYCNLSFENDTYIMYAIKSNDPTTTSADFCYDRMFFGCTSLTAVPELPATTLADNCYHRMFYGCSGIKLSAAKTGIYQNTWSIPALQTNAVDWNTDMFDYTGGTFTGYPQPGVVYYQAGSAS